MKRLLVACLFLLHAWAYAETPAQVRIRVKLPFEPDSPGAVVLPVGTLVTVLWAQDDRLMIRYRRIEGLVPAVTIHYVAGEHPGDIRQYRPEPAPREKEGAVSRTASTANTYRAPPRADQSAESASGIFALPKSVIGAGVGVVLFVLILSSLGRGKDGNERPALRRQS